MLVLKVQAQYNRNNMYIYGFVYLKPKCFLTLLPTDLDGHILDQLLEITILSLLMKMQSLLVSILWHSDTFSIGFICKVLRM